VLKYRTIASKSDGFLKDRGSKLHAYAAHAVTEDDAKAFVNEVQLQHPKCRHVCFAYRIGTDEQPDGKQGRLFRTYDAGEPSGSAGQPILNRIDGRDITNVIVVVARYFGGTKLGFSGLVRAYRDAAGHALKRAALVTRKWREQYLVRCPFDSMDQVMNFLSRDGVTILEQQFYNKCMFRVKVGEHGQSLLNDLKRFSLISIEPLSINS